MAVRQLPPHVVFIQLNDIYHIDAKSNYAVPNSLIFPRLATLLARARAYFREIKTDSYLCVPGDFVAPSCLSKRTYGAHMIELLKALGTAFVTFGNHEFETFGGTGDKGPTDPFPLFGLMETSGQIKWVSSNFEFADRARAQRLKASGKLVSHADIRLSDDHDLTMLGLLYEAKSFEFHDYGETADPSTTAKKMIGDLDAVCAPDRLRSYVALTHQYVFQDHDFAKKVDRVRLIMGGHDHSVRYRERAPKSLIVKTMSDGRTIRFNWVVEVSGEDGDLVTWARAGDEGARKALVQWMMKEVCLPVFMYMLTGSKRKGQELTGKEQKAIYEFLQAWTKAERDPNRGIPETPGLALATVGDRYLVIFSLLINPVAKGFLDLLPADPDVLALVQSYQPEASTAGKVILKAPMELVIQDNDVRRFSTNFGNIVADVLLGRFDDDPAKSSEVSLMNSGSFRIDRNIQKDEPMTPHTLCDIFFHANDIRRFDLPGDTIQKILEHSLTLRNRNPDEGHGEFLQVGGLAVKVAKGGGIGAVTHIPTKGKPEQIDPARNYTVATTKFVAKRCSEFKHFFDGQDGELLNDSVESAVASGLQKLASLRRSRQWTSITNRLSESRWIGL
jgi:2',3'-cyclic-nucleotide 2'-phosphodiesterase (5'-nucleotidase family)